MVTVPKDAKYRLYKYPDNGQAVIARSPYDGQPEEEWTYGLWTSMNPVWEEEDQDKGELFASDPFFSNRDAYYEFTDITPEEAEKIIRSYDSK